MVGKKCHHEDFRPPVVSKGMLFSIDPEELEIRRCVTNFQVVDTLGLAVKRRLSFRFRVLGTADHGKTTKQRRREKCGV